MNVKRKWFGYDVLVIAGLVLLALALGGLNNLRVYPERRVPWTGMAVQHPAHPAGARR